jgi:hypothetical protein
LAAKSSSCKPELLDCLKRKREKKATRSMILKKKHNFFLLQNDKLVWLLGGKSMCRIGVGHGKAMTLSRNADEEVALLRTTTTTPPRFQEPDCSIGVDRIEMQ